MLSLPDVLKEKPLDEFAVAEGKSRSIARQIVPEYEVVESVSGSEFFLWKMNRTLLLARSQTQVAPGAEHWKLSWKAGTGTETIDVRMREHAVACPVPREAEAAAIGMSPRQWAIEYCTQQIVNSIDAEFVDLLKDADNFTGGSKSSADWETNATSLQTQIANAKLAVKEKVERTPDTLICGPTAYEKLGNWLNVDGALPAIEQVRNQLNIGRIFEIPKTTADANPEVAFSGGGGTGARAIAEVLGGKVTEVKIVNGGTGYSSTPAVSFPGGRGTGATGTATVSVGAVTAVSVTDGGSGYTSFYYDDEAVLIVNAAAEARFAHTHSAFFISSETNFVPKIFHEEPIGDWRVVGEPSEYPSDSGEYAGVRTICGFGVLSPRSGYRYTEVT